MIKQYRLSNGFIGTEKQAIDKGMFVSSEVKQVPRIQYNRTKFNRMNNKEQEVYDKKLKETKTEYRLYNKDGSFVVASLSAYTYFNGGKE